MVSGRLSFNLEDDYTSLDALDRLGIKHLYTAGLLGTQRKDQNVECWIGPEVLGDLARFFPLGFLTRVFGEISGSRLIFFSLG
jgi:hypothetical protein